MVLHGAVLYAVTRYSPEPAVRSLTDPPSVVWLAELSIPALPDRTPPPTTDEPADLPEVPEPADPPEAPELADLPEAAEPADLPEAAEPADVPEAAEPAPEAAESAVREDLEASEPAEAADAVLQSDVEAAPAPDPVAGPDEPADDVSPADPASGPSRNYIVREVDLNEARRRAIEQTTEQLEQEDRYLTFSMDDMREPELPTEPGPTESVFEAAERSESPPSLMSAGKARGAFARRVFDFCNALTGGGIGLMGFATLCADQPEAVRLFAHLKPAYLRSRPVCDEVEGADASSDPDLAVKCRLVVGD